jgi:hypothetical protein
MRTMTRSGLAALSHSYPSPHFSSLPGRCISNEGLEDLTAHPERRSLGELVLLVEVVAVFARRSREAGPTGLVMTETNFFPRMIPDFMPNCATSTSPWQSSAAVLGSQPHVRPREPSWGLPPRDTQPRPHANP